MTCASARNTHAPESSRVIVSDKKAGRIFNYDLAGKLHQALAVPKPGNIDIRQNVTVDGRPRDVVAVNDRGPDWRVRIFIVDPKSRDLVPADGGKGLASPRITAAAWLMTLGLPRSGSCAPRNKAA